MMDIETVYLSMNKSVDPLLIPLISTDSLGNPFPLFAMVLKSKDYKRLKDAIQKSERSGHTPLDISAHKTILVEEGSVKIGMTVMVAGILIENTAYRVVGAFYWNPPTESDYPLYEKFASTLVEYQKKKRQVIPVWIAEENPINIIKKANKPGEVVAEYHVMSIPVKPEIHTLERISAFLSNRGLIPFNTLYNMHIKGETTAYEKVMDKIDETLNEIEWSVGKYIIATRLSKKYPQITELLNI